MSCSGRVRVWHDEEGWGVIDSDVTPGGCWAHFSSVRVAGYRVLTPGQDVTFGFEAAEQDGYSFRAVEVRPTHLTPARNGDDSAPSPAYGSELTVTVDDDQDRGVP